MNPVVIGYLGFVVAALILIWAVFELTRRLNRRRKIDARALETWVKLDSTRANAPDETHSVTGNEDEPEDDSDSEMRTRAHQNGHYSESKKPL